MAERAQVGGHEPQPAARRDPPPRRAAASATTATAVASEDRHDDHRRRRAVEPGQVERPRDEQHRRGEDGEHHLAGRALPRDAAQPTPHVTVDPSVLHPAPDVAEHPAGQRGVEELGAVARAHGAAEGEVGAQSARDEPPPPGPAQRGEQRR